MNKTFRKNLLRQLSVAFGIIIILAVSFFFIKRHIKESVAQITSARQELSHRTAVLNELSDLRSQYKRFGQPYLNVLSNIIPEKDKLIDISQDFQTIASQDDLEFGFSFLGERVPEDSSELGYIEFRLNIKGESMNGISDFIERIEDFRYLTTVNRVDIRRNRELNEITLILQGRVYFQ